MARSAEEVPAIPGVYSLWAGRRCLYVGKSDKNIRGRVRTHLRQLARFGITRVLWRACDRPALEECLVIYVLDPPLNSTAKVSA